MRKLTARQSRFVKEYLISLNASDAARRAGYAPQNVRVVSTNLLKKPHVSAAVAKAQKKVADKLEITAERVLREIALCGFANMDDYTASDGDTLRLDLSKTTREQRAAIAELTEDTTGGTGDGERKLVLRTKIKLWDKSRNLELLGRHLKLFTDKMEHSVDEGLAGLLAMKRRLDGDSSR